MPVEIRVWAESGDLARKEIEAFLGGSAPADEPVDEPASPVEETKPARRRGRPPKAKAATAADIPAEVVEEAKAAGIEVKTLSEPDETDEPELDLDEAAKPLTMDDVRNMLVDLINDVQAKHPDDKDIKLSTLKAILEKLGAQQIKGIDEAKYRLVPALVAEVRKREGLE